MSEIENQLPADIDTLHALMVAACAERDAAIAERETAIGERDRALSQIDRLRHLLRQLQRAHFGKRSEKLDPDQLLLTLEDIEQAIAESEAHDDKKDAIAAKVRAEKRRANRGALPRHLPRVDVTIAPEDTNCPCCRTPMHVIGEETSERLDVIPAQFRVIVTHRPKYACRACEEAPVQAPAPERLIKGGLPTEAMVAYVLAAKYAWHLPLYRQAQILLSQGVAIERATLAFWVGYAAAELKPLYLRLRELILGSLKIAVDETVAPVLDPGRGRTKKGYFWAIARDDRPWGGTDPPAIAYTYAPGRGAVHALKLLDTYHGPLGPTRLELSKPVIAAMEGPAVAGGMELALWCDLRVMAETAYIGVYCRRWGIPLIDGGTVRLPRLVGQGRALDIILTGRKVTAEECYRIGACERVAPDGGARELAEQLAHEIARFPQACVRSDRM